MSLLQWDDSFVTGIPIADHEHQHLVSLINRVHAGWARENNGDTARLFDDLFNILLSHFDVEERMMSGCVYAGRPAHSRDHDRILDALRAILAEADDGTSNLTGALAACLQPWLVDHIRHHDVPLYRAVEAASADISAL
jgi:hemerythrin-like metal-binding protein